MLCCSRKSNRCSSKIVSRWTPSVFIFFPHCCSVHYWMSLLSKHFARSALPDYRPKITSRVYLLYKSVIITESTVCCAFWCCSQFQSLPLEKCSELNSPADFTRHAPAALLLWFMCWSAQLFIDLRQMPLIGSHFLLYHMVCISVLCQCYLS